MSSDDAKDERSSDVDGSPAAAPLPDLVPDWMSADPDMSLWAPDPEWYDPAQLLLLDARERQWWQDQLELRGALPVSPVLPPREHDPAPEPAPEPEPEAGPAPEIAPEPAPEPEPEAGLASEPEPVPDPALEPEPVPDPALEPEAEPAPEEKEKPRAPSVLSKLSKALSPLTAKLSSRSQSNEEQTAAQDPYRPRFAVAPAWTRACAILLWATAGICIVASAVAVALAVSSPGQISIPTLGTLPTTALWIAVLALATLSILGILAGQGIAKGYRNWYLVGLGVAVATLWLPVVAAPLLLTLAQRDTRDWVI